MSKKALLLVFIFTIFINIISASQLNVGFAFYDETNTYSNLEKQLFANLIESSKNIKIDTYFLKIKQNRFERENSILVRLGEKEKLQTVKQIEGINYKKIELSEQMLEQVKAENLIVTQYIFEKNNIDIIVLLSISKLSDYLKVSLKSFEYRAKNSIKLFEQIALKGEINKIVAPLNLSLNQYFSKQKLGLLTFNIPKGNYLIKLNDKEVSLIDNYLILEPNFYQLKISGPNIETIEENIEIENKKEVIFTKSIKAKKGKPLLVTSLEPNLKFQIVGEKESVVPSLLTNQNLPLAIVYEKENNLLYSLQQSQRTDQIRLDFTSVFKDTNETIAFYQNQFYTSLGKSLIFGALTLLVDFLSTSLISDNLKTNAWQPLLLVGSSITALYTIESTFHLFAYYQKTKYSF
jgi:hypothetical protein